MFIASASIRAVVDYLDRVDQKQPRSPAGIMPAAPWRVSPPFMAGGPSWPAILRRRRPDSQACFRRRLTCKTMAKPSSTPLQNTDRRAAKEYYRLMYRSSRRSWNLRDRHMFTTLQALLAHRGAGEAVIWAHNSYRQRSGGRYGLGGRVQHWRTVPDGLRVTPSSSAARIAALSPRRAGPADGSQTVLPAARTAMNMLFRKTGLARSLTDARPRKTSRTFCENRCSNAPSALSIGRNRVPQPLLRPCSRAVRRLCLVPGRAVTPFNWSTAWRPDTYPSGCERRLVAIRRQSPSGPGPVGALRATWKAPKGIASMIARTTWRLA
jgi:hypothetical protein